MAHSGIRITEVQVDDVRVPTSDSLLGSDPFHRKPDYSAAIVRIKTNSEHVGWSVVFSIGAGTDWLAVAGQPSSSCLVGVLLSSCRFGSDSAVKS